MTTTGVGVGGGMPLCSGHHPKVPLFFDAAPKTDTDKAIPICALKDKNANLRMLLNMLSTMLHISVPFNSFNVCLQDGWTAWPTKTKIQCSTIIHQPTLRTNHRHHQLSTNYVNHLLSSNSTMSVNHFHKPIATLRESS